MSVPARDRIRGEIVQLVHQDLDLRGFSLRAAAAVRRIVPFDGVCVLALDPATMLPTGEVVENGLPPEACRRMTEIEFREPDVNSFTALAASGRLAASLSEATEGR